MTKRKNAYDAGNTRMLYLAFTFAALAVVFNATMLSHIEEVRAMLNY